MITFQLEGADGLPHRYEVQLHPASDGQVIMWRLMALGAAPLGRLLGAAAKLDGVLDVVRAAARGDENADSEGAKLLDGIDFGAIGGDIGAALGKGDAPGLTLLILQHTYRDGDHLAEPLKFDAAFRGNYFELLKAVAEVVRHNRFLPLPITLPSVAR